MSDWWIFKGTNKPHDDLKKLPDPPPWRRYTEVEQSARWDNYQIGEDDLDIINAALYLRRPLLVTGKPGTGKSSLAYAIARELNLGAVLRWSINTRSTLQEGLYNYDAIARLQDTPFNPILSSTHTTIGNEKQVDQRLNPSNIGRYIRLGPLGNAFVTADNPRVLLIDEIDKSDIDLPNDLLHIFEEGEFNILELKRLPEEFRNTEVFSWDGKEKINIDGGVVRCQVFPIVIMTSNGERAFPPAFLRRCLPLEIKLPDKDKLTKIIAARLNLSPEMCAEFDNHIKEFLHRRDDKNEELATDQLLNVIYITLNNIDPLKRDKMALINALLKSLSGSGLD